MQNFWKFLSLALLCLSLALVYYLYSTRKPKLNPNEISLKDFDRDNFEYRKKQNAQYSKDLNDYFYKNQTSIRFLKDLYDFDTIREGQNIIENIQYINEGQQPFFITEVKVTCGCTIPSYDKKPVNPKDTGLIQVEFKSKGKEGFVMNKLAVYGNIEGGEKAAYFKVYVVK